MTLYQNAMRAYRQQNLCGSTPDQRAIEGYTRIALAAALDAYTAAIEDAADWLIEKEYPEVAEALKASLLEASDAG